MWAIGEMWLLKILEKSELLEMLKNCMINVVTSNKLKLLGLKTVLLAYQSCFDLYFLLCLRFLKFMMCLRFLKDALIESVGRSILSQNLKHKLQSVLFMPIEL